MFSCKDIKFSILGAFFTDPNLAILDNTMISQFKNSMTKFEIIFRFYLKQRKTIDISIIYAQKQIYNNIVQKLF
jgi:hypothetical protein